LSVSNSTKIPMWNGMPSTRLSGLGCLNAFHIQSRRKGKQQVIPIERINVQPGSVGQLVTK